MNFNASLSYGLGLLLAIALANANTCIFSVPSQEVGDSSELCDAAPINAWTPTTKQRIGKELIWTETYFAHVLIGKTYWKCSADSRPNYGDGSVFDFVLVALRMLWICDVVFYCDAERYINIFKKKTRFIKKKNA